MKKQCTQAIVNRVENTLGLPILLGGIGTRKPELDAEVREKKAHGIGVILLAIVHLKC